MAKETIKIVQLDNKARRGTYLYIKLADEKKGSYYAYDPAKPIDFYKKYHEDKQLKEDKKRGMSVKKYTETFQQVAKGEELPISKKLNKDKQRIVSEAQKYLKKIKKQYKGKTLEKLLNKGIQAVQVPDAYKMNPAAIRIANKRLLEDLVLDKKLLNIMSEDQNMQKLAGRIEHRVKVIGEKGEPIITCNKIGITLTQAINELTNTIKKEETITSEGYKKSLKTKQIANIGYQNVTSDKDGKVNRIEIISILRKGK